MEHSKIHTLNYTLHNKNDLLDYMLHNVNNNINSIIIMQPTNYITTFQMTPCYIS